MYFNYFFYQINKLNNYIFAHYIFNLKLKLNNGKFKSF